MGKKKGKAQNGRAKQKVKAKGGTPRSTPRSKDSLAQQALGSDWDEEDSPLHFRGFKHKAPSSSFPSRTQPTSLRHTGISFVSAGAIAPAVNPPQSSADDLDLTASSDEDDLDDDDVNDSMMHTNIMLEADMETSSQGVANMDINSTSMLQEHTLSTTTSDVNITGIDDDVTAESSLFFIDTKGDASMAGLSKTPRYTAVKRAPSPARSDSSEEVIVFHGRNGAPKVVSDPIVQPQTSLPTRNRNLSPLPQGSSSSTAVGWGAQQSKHDATNTNRPNWTPAPAVPYWKKGKGRAVPRPDLGPDEAERKAFEELPAKASKVKFREPSTLQDPTQSLQATRSDAIEDRKGSRNGEIDLQRLDVVKDSPSQRRNKRGRKKDNRAMRKAVESDDGMSESAYDDYMQNMLAQLENEEGGKSREDFLAGLKASSHIAGPSLVVDGREIAEDEVLPRSMKDDNMEDSSIQLADGSGWETDDSDMNPDLNELSSESSMMNASDLESSELEVELEYTERQQWEDEDDLRQRRIERMSDEHYARLLEKQQSLGFDTDELLLEDGQFAAASDIGFGDIKAAQQSLSDMSKSTFARTATARNGMRRRNDQHFPSASAFADTLDQYGDNGFDIMDFERPSLRPTKKGRKGKLPPELEELSDDELREGMAGQWEKDRSKKRQKKLEREEQRMAGLLGSAGRKGQADLKAKYRMGMDMQQVHDELRSFLQDEDLQQRAFPPMDKGDRKALHEISVALGLSSKSQGYGRNRFPIVNKTSRTHEYSSETFMKIVQASSRGFLSNHGKAKNFAKKGGVKGPRGGQGGGVAAASVRHGEVVGAGAAEISHDSFGHKMMLKMGWTKGQALGKDGEGLLVPVEQRMRVGTAGLG